MFYILNRQYAESYTLERKGTNVPNVPWEFDVNWSRVSGPVNAAGVQPLTGREARLGQYSSKVEGEW